jgi:MraZ protein
LTSSDLIFKGEFVHQVDEKVRFKLPVKMQEVFENELGLMCVLMKMPEGCLALYPAERWQAEYGKYLSGADGKTPVNADYRKLSRYIGSRSTDLKIGVQGRVAIPEGFREYIEAEAGKNVVITGAGERLEIWNESRWQEQRDGDDGEFFDLLEKASEQVFRLEREDGGGGAPQQGE